VEVSRLDGGHSFVGDAGDLKLDAPLDVTALVGQSLLIADWSPDAVFCAR